MPCIAFSSDALSPTSPIRASTLPPKRQATFFWSRLSTATVSPRVSSSLTMTEPTKPVPPVTKIEPGLGALQGLHRERDAVGGRDVVLHVGHLALLVNDEVAAGDAHELAAVALSLYPDAVRLGDLLVFVREQREGQAELVAEALVGLDAVRTHAQHNRVLGLDIAIDVAKAAGLGRAAGGVVLGVEVEDDALAAVVAQLDLLSLVRRRLEIRSLVTDLDLSHESPSSITNGPTEAGTMLSYALLRFLSQAFPGQQPCKKIRLGRACVAFPAYKGWTRWPAGLIP